MEELNSNYYEKWLSKQSEFVQELLSDGAIWYNDLHHKAVVGVIIANEKAGISSSIYVYDMDKAYDYFHKEMGENARDVLSHIDYNIVGGWVGEFTPMCLYPDKCGDWETRFGDIPKPTKLIGIGLRCGQRDVVVLPHGHEDADKTFMEDDPDGYTIQAVEMVPVNNETTHGEYNEKQ